MPQRKVTPLAAGCGLLAVTAGGFLAARQLLRPYDVPEFAEIDTSESAFLIPLDGDAAKQAAFPSAELLDQRKVAVKRVQIPHRWQELGRLPGQGQWVPTVRLVKVDRRPVTRLWTREAGSGTSPKDEAVAAETKESINFSMGVTCTAYIPEEQAATFLYSYPSKSLADMLDVEVRGRIQQVLSEEAARYTLEQLPARKNDVIQAVRADVVPYFQQRGIQVSSIGLYGGITYANPDIQRAIDDGAKAAQQKVIAEARAEAAKAEAKGKADAELIAVESQAKVKIAVARQEAEAQAARAEAEARAKRAVAEAELVATEAQAKVRLALARAEAEAEGVRAEAQARVKRAAAEAEADGQRKLAEVRVYEATEAAGPGADVYVRLRQLEAESARWKTWDGKFPTTWMPVGEKATPFTALFPPLPWLPAATATSAAAK
jgi:regulator of protease activity HflC (stomatin/prohibitin superfamily)